MGLRLQFDGPAGYEVDPLGEPHPLVAASVYPHPLESERAGRLLQKHGFPAVRLHEDPFEHRTGDGHREGGASAPGADVDGQADFRCPIQGSEGLSEIAPDALFAATKAREPRRAVETLDESVQYL